MNKKFIFQTYLDWIQKIQSIDVGKQVIDKNCEIFYLGLYNKNRLIGDHTRSETEILILFY